MKLLGLEKTQKSSLKSMGKMNKKREEKGEKLMDFPPLKLPGESCRTIPRVLYLSLVGSNVAVLLTPFLGERGAFGPEKTFVHAPPTGAK